MNESLNKLLSHHLLLIDSLGRPTVKAGSDHYYDTWCLYVRHLYRNLENHY